MNIPDSAVEAAAIAMCNHVEADTWGGLSEANRGWYRDKARIPLEAAAPHLITESGNK